MAGPVSSGAPARTPATAKVVNSWAVTGSGLAGPRATRLALCHREIGRVADLAQLLQRDPGGPEQLLDAVEVEAVVGRSAYPLGRSVPTPAEEIDAVGIVARVCDDVRTLPPLESTQAVPKRALDRSRIGAARGS